MVQFGEFLKPEACCQTVLPDRSILIGQKLAENAKIEKSKCEFSILKKAQKFKMNETF